jgi:general secretion pathway protein A
MYIQYFGLRENPFALPPDPRYLYLSRRHQEALAHLIFGITEGGGFVQLTGEVGTGKTMIIRALLERLPENVDVALVLYPMLSAQEFIAAICDDLRVPYQRPATSLKPLIDALNQYLLDNHAKGRRTVLIIDEAHLLNRDVLEQVRLLTNLETTKEKLLQIMLIGQPELKGLLAQEDLRQLAQRVTARYEIHALAPAETREYVIHRCRVGGARRHLFTEGALRAVHRLSGGIPRVINVLCDRALLGAYARGKGTVSTGLLRRASREISQAVPTPQRPGPAWWAGAAAATVAVAVGALLIVNPPWLQAWWGIERAEPPVAQAVEASPAAASDAAAGNPASAVAAVPPGDGTVTAAAVAPPEPPPPPSLQELLHDPAVRHDTESAFAMLLAYWGLDYTELEGNGGCERAEQAQLVCHYGSGTWNNLRQLNRPAIIELIDGENNRHHVVVKALREDRAVVGMNGREYEFALSDVDRYWLGKYLMLWRQPYVEINNLRRGARGPAVVWLRETLARSTGREPQVSLSEMFDAELETHVRAFQRQHLLAADGIVGHLTVIQLSVYDPTLGSPLLATAPAVGTP